MTDLHGAAQPGRLSIHQSILDGIRIIALRGEIDHDVRNALSQALLSFDGVTPPRTMVDLSGVTFMDSSGTNALIVAQKRMSNARRWLHIAGAQDAVLRILQLVGLDQVIDCSAQAAAVRDHNYAVQDRQPLSRPSPWPRIIPRAAGAPGRCQ